MEININDGILRVNLSLLRTNYLFIKDKNFSLAKFNMLNLARKRSPKTVKGTICMQNYVKLYRKQRLKTMNSDDKLFRILQLTRCRNLPPLVMLAGILLIIKTR